MDTFAYRQLGWAAKLRIFEVDHPESQNVKREHLARRGIRIPANVEFLPRLRAQITSGGPPCVLAGPACAGVLFVARGYTVLDQGSDRFHPAVPSIDAERERTGYGVHPSSGFVDA